MRGGSGGASRLATDFPCIASWSRDDLSAIADNTDAALTDAAVHALPDVQAWAKAHAALLEEVERAAARNEARRPELESLRSETRRAYEHARTLQAQWPAVERALHEARKRFMPFAMQSQLQMAANQLHDESEAFANAYVEGLTPMDDTVFVRQYLDLRTRHHVHSMLQEQCAQRRVQWQA